MHTRKWLIVISLVIMCIGFGTTQVSAAVSSVNNNFTILDPNGGITGGSNDVVFTWDGTKKTGVAVSGQVSNATLSSTCLFFSVTWSAHDVAIYGPGIYTVYTDCPAGSPGCGTTSTPPITFTVGANQIGLHFLFDWGGNNDMDVVDVLSPNAVFGPSPMCTDELNCGGWATCSSNSAGTVWSYMSSDGNGDGINGYPMVDGPFAGFNANFNVNTVGTENNNFTMINETGGLTGGTNDVLFTWNGTKKTAVAASGQVSNATLSSTCPFFSINWTAHDVAIYGPGTYTVYADCLAGEPGCGLGVPITFTVATGQLGAHMLFDWGGNNNIDVVDVWVPNAAFAPSAMCAYADNCGGQATCGANPATTVWNWMSSDWEGDGISGFPMVDGPFASFNANFNVMSVPPIGCLEGTRDPVSGCCIIPPTRCNDNNPCTIDSIDCATGSVCIHTPKVCNDNNACTTDSCNPATGCMFTPIVCPGGLICNPMDGSCCPGCVSDSICNDNNACTKDTCVGCEVCMYTPIFCDDNNACTLDTCNTATGCVFTPVNCNDNVACTSDSCDPATGCVYTSTCPTGQTCTPSGCTSGCITGADCYDGNQCTYDFCNTATGVCSNPPITCDDNNACTSDRCNPAGNICEHTAINCNDNNNLTIDTCDPATGNCVHIPINPNDVYSFNNNFTMLAPDGGLTGGTNDVMFTWNGTKKTAVAASGQVPNAQLVSTCPFFGLTWAAHDMAIYGPGTYTVFDGCPAGSPGCGTGNVITFTVLAGNLGVHMLFDWGGNNDIDVVNVWVPNAVFGPSAMCADENNCGGQATCGANLDTKLWDWMSSDWDGDGFNGFGMTDGPFVGFNANFNTMGVPPVPVCVPADCNDNNACTTDVCNTATGVCSKTPKICTDNNACTTDTCNTATGACVFTPKVCPVTNACFTATCNTATGVCGQVAKNCSDNNACTTDSCNTASGNCVFTTKNCDDNNACTTDTCNTATGCRNTPPGTCTIYSPYTSNFTMVDPTGKTIGGTNDVAFAWDGTRKTSVAASSQASNAYIVSTCPYAGITWSVHDIAIYGPGTYTTYAGCPAGSPGCGTGTAITFTCGENQLCAHMLMNWGASVNIDVVNVWSPTTVFAPTALWTGSCKTQAAAKVWDLMSSDWDGDGINGKKMVDGPFLNFSANFNLMAPCPASCDDNNACTVDSCVFAACVHTPIVCNDNNACTTDTCDTATSCVFNPIVCNDSNACTTDTCDTATGCVFTPIVCNDNNACTAETCNTATGCMFTPISSDDSDICTVDTCNPVTGAVHTPTVPASCHDNNACTTDGCTNNACTYTPIVCNDNNACTTESCNTTTGCVFTPIICNDNNACTTDTCNATTGCVFTPIICNDNLACTSDSCDPATGCVYANACPPGLICNPMDGSCCPGCVSDAICNDNNACTKDKCVGCEVCMSTPIVCNDNNACTADSCNPATGCVFTRINCNDNNPCTTDTCNTAAGCVHIPRICDDRNICTIDSCDTATGVCVYAPNDAVCAPTSNNNFTMIDPTNTAFGGTNDVEFSWDGTTKTSVAASGQVSNALLSSTCPFFGTTWAANDVAVYGPGTFTVYSGCVAGSPGCGSGAPITFTVNTGEIGIHMLFDWNQNYNIDVVNVLKPNSVSSNMWTGACGSNPSNRVWMWASYDFDGDGINGTPMVDGPFVGMNANFNLMMADCPDAARCNDNNACTIDPCFAPVVCTYTPVNCDDNNACTADSCNPSTGCVHTPIICNDNNTCTSDSCIPATGCVYTHIPGCGEECGECLGDFECPTGMKCNASTLCLVSCSCPQCTVCAGHCVVADCNDNNACTMDTYVAGTGCVHTPIVCNDNNLCTSDTCSTATGCVYTPKDCNDNNVCTTDSCDPAIGCVHTAVICNDGNCGTIDTCNPATGCIYTPITCDDGNACTLDTYDCTLKLCVHTLINCNDNNACTIDTCNSATGACVHTPIVCNDNNLCTIDSCNAAAGCVFTPRVCNDNNACTTDACNTATGTCVYTPISCPSGSTCQNGICASTCPKGSYQSVTLRGTGSGSWWTEGQIMTQFTVSGSGCILRYTANKLTVTPTTVLKVDWTKGYGPNPLSVTWAGVSVPAMTVPYTINSGWQTGPVGSLVLSNTSVNGGKDTDTLTVSVANK